MSGRPWTPAEHRMLVEMTTARRPYAEIARRLGRSVAAVARQASHKGLGLRKTWTAAEDRALVKMVKAGDRPGVIANRTDRTIRAVTDRIAKLRAAGRLPRRQMVSGRNDIRMRPGHIRRPCRRCEIDFMSQGAHHRYCDPCRKTLSRQETDWSIAA